MTPQNFVMHHARKQFSDLGYSEKDANQVASRAIKLWLTNKNATLAIREAIAEGKKMYKKRSKARPKAVNVYQSKQNQDDLF